MHSTECQLSSKNVKVLSSKNVKVFINPTFLHVKC